VRAVLDPNVLVSAVLSGRGTPARVVRAWLAGAYELVVSPHLLVEVDRVLAYPKIRKRVTADESAGFIALLAAEADGQPDPDAPPSVASADVNDDHLIALAEAATAVLVSGDHHLLDLAGRIPVYSPAEFLGLLED
jgi:uncharacterized protein